MKRRNWIRIMSMAMLFALGISTLGGAILMSAAAGEAGATGDAGSEPLFVWDFSREDDDFGFTNRHMHTDQMNGYMRFKAYGDDPHVSIMAPDRNSAEYAAAVIVYRTKVTHRANFYAGFRDGQPISEATRLNWDWVCDGQLNTVVVDLDMYRKVGKAFTELRFDPMNGVDGPVTSGEYVDVYLMAFFGSKEEASRFDYETYVAQQAALAEAEAAAAKEQQRLEDEAIRQSWTQPAFAEVDTAGRDNREGTLVYTPSEDGTGMTISYRLNGETVSYTVPNQVNYLSGPLAGVDDLGRTMYNQYSQAQIHETLPETVSVGVLGEGGEHYVGVFYFLNLGEGIGTEAVYNMEEIIAAAGDKAGSYREGGWGPIWYEHFFYEPLFGYYVSRDEWVIRKNMELLSLAGVDFLYFDITNARPFLANVRRVMKVCHELNEQGFDAPQIVFYTNSQAHEMVQQVYREIYEPGLYPDTWFCVDGKPLIIAPKDANINDFFTIRLNQWPNERKKQGSWPWIDFTWDQEIYRGRGENGNDTAMSVSVAQHAGTVMFSDSRLYGDRTNRGRSYNGVYVKNADGRYVYQSTGNYDKLTEDSYKYGYNLQSQFSRAILADVDYVLVTGWNEWCAAPQPASYLGLPDSSDKVILVDACGLEYSRDMEMARGAYFDNYYMQLAFNIQTIKGAAPTIVQDKRKTINVTGAFDQWADIAVAYADPAGDTYERNCVGYGNVTYTDTTGRNDIVSSKVTLDSENLYFYIQTARAITKYDGQSSWMNIYLNTDEAQTGWYGYDYIINYAVKDDCTGLVGKCNTSDGSYGFEVVGETSMKVDGCEMMISVPLEVLGITDYRQVYFTFKIADSDTVYNTMEGFYEFGDAAPLGRLNYVFQNYIPGVSDLSMEEETTAADTEPATEPETKDEGGSAPSTEAPTGANGETDTEGGEKPAGCASVVSLGWGSTVPAALGLLLKKKKRR